MYYRLNRSHSFNPKTHGNIAAVNRVTEYLSDGKVASEEELRGVLAGINNPHGCVVKWLARRSRKVLIPATRIDVSEELLMPTGAKKAEPTPSQQVEDYGDLGIWTNPHEVDLSQPLLYRIELFLEDGTDYDYIGKARNISRLREYDRNMKKIRDGRERGKTQGYRAVHFALYQALENGWRVNCYPLENCSSEQLNAREGQLISQYPCNLNDGKSWRVSDMAGITLESLLRR